MLYPRRITLHKGLVDKIRAVAIGNKLRCANVCSRTLRTSSYSFGDNRAPRDLPFVRGSYLVT